MRGCLDRSRARASRRRSYVIRRARHATDSLMMMRIHQYSSSGARISLCRCISDRRGRRRSPGSSRAGHSRGRPCHGSLRLLSFTFTCGFSSVCVDLYHLLSSPPRLLIECKIADATRSGQIIVDVELIVFCSSA